ncbi:MAG: CDP-archaeol synthase [Chloroflexi bacterium]|nr:CDP-archaeol synthase [Chloroflexota bacterium]
MLRERVAVSLFGLILSAWLITTGGWAFAFAVAILSAAAAYEYGILFRNNTLRPAVPILVLAVFIIDLLRFSGNPGHSATALAMISLIAILWHIADYEKGATKSGTDFAITLAGIVYLGWIGAYLISLRELQDGMQWMFIALSSIWIADSAAYFTGNWIGKRKLVPRLSPGKTWEGYLGGILFGSLSGMAAALILMELTPNAATLSGLRGFIIGAVISIFALFGDLGISMFKREFQTKNTGKLFLGHGGVLDRIDSWLWAGVLGFYVVSLFQL